jgi:hypothetical protein
MNQGYMPQMQMNGMSGMNMWNMPDQFGMGNRGMMGMNNNMMGMTNMGMNNSMGMN